MKALRLHGVTVLSGRCRTELPPSWATLVDRLDRRQRGVLLPFVRHCIEQRIGPHDVNQQTFDRFTICLERYSSRANRRKKFLALCRVWNACSAQIEAWPRFRAEIIYQFDRYMVPLDQFPPSFHQDVEAMIAASTRVDLLALRPRKALRPATAAKNRYTVYRIASACISRGIPPASLLCLTDLVDPEVLLPGLDFLLERAGNEVKPDHYKIAETMYRIARDHTSLPESKLKKLATIRTNLRIEQTEMTEKNRRTLRWFEDEELVAAFLDLPGRIVRRLVRKHTLTRLDTVRLQEALAIELLTFTAIRISNLVGIQLDRNLVTVGQGAGQSMHLVFSPQEVKNNIALEFELSDSAAKLLDLYLRVARPKLADASNRFLFPGKVQDHKQAAHMSSQLARLVFQEAGVRLTAHQFRHVAGYLYLQRNPGDYEHVRQLLGHKDILTTMRFYAGMERAAAVRAHDRFVNARRQELGVDPLPTRSGRS
jgi:integrase